MQEALSTVEQLREISRQHYLEKREEKELKLLEMGAYVLPLAMCMTKHLFLCILLLSALLNI